MDKQFGDPNLGFVLLGIIFSFCFAGLNKTVQNISSSCLEDCAFYHFIF